MVVGLLVVDCLLGKGHSLKEKRQVLLSLTQRIRNRYNISIAEIDHQNLWQRSKLGVACVNSEWQATERILNNIVRIMEHEPRFTLLNFEYQKIY